jgi:hypothetical protein
VRVWAGGGEDEDGDLVGFGADLAGLFGGDGSVAAQEGGGVAEAEPGGVGAGDDQVWSVAFSAGEVAEAPPGRDERAVLRGKVFRAGEGANAEKGFLSSAGGLFLVENFIEDIVGRIEEVAGSRSALGAFL